jgi:hypothetical protein
VVGEFGGRREFWGEFGKFLELKGDLRDFRGFR